MILRYLGFVFSSAFLVGCDSTTNSSPSVVYTCPEASALTFNVTQVSPGHGGTVTASGSLLASNNNNIPFETGSVVFGETSSQSCSKGPLTDTSCQPAIPQMPTSASTQQTVLLGTSGNVYCNYAIPSTNTTAQESVLELFNLPGGPRLQASCKFTPSATNQITATPDKTTYICSASDFSSCAITCGP